MSPTGNPIARVPDHPIILGKKFTGPRQLGERWNATAFEAIDLIKNPQLL